MSTIAVIEDNHSNMKLIKGILENAGYKTLVAMNAEEGMAMIHEHLPDLVLMDIHLPGTDGLSATRMLKEERKTRHIPIIAVTARAMDGDLKSIMDAGCDGYAAKPIRYKEVLALIAELLERFQ